MNFQTANSLIVSLCIVTLLLIISSCKNKSLAKYEKFVKEADAFEIYYPAANKTIPVEEGVENFRKILLRNIKPEFQRKFKTDAKILFYKKGRQTGSLMIDRENGFVNFHSENLNFGFGLTYGIGMTVDNLQPRDTAKIINK